MKPLLKAIMENDEAAVRQILLTDTPDLNKESFPSAIAFASELKLHSIARLLLIAGADPNHPMGAPIVLAAKNNDLEMAKLLSNAGADLEIEEGSALKEAEKAGSREVADYLRSRSSVLIENSRRESFKPETLKTYRKLLNVFKEVETLEGCCYRVKLSMLGGEVFLHQCKGDAGEYYDVQWWGKPEPFGFRIYPDRKVYGPYHFH